MAKDTRSYSLNTPSSSRNLPSDSNSLLASLNVKSHGTITFRRNYSNRANFIRISPDASPIHVQELFVRPWQNKHPSLIISISGSTREYSMKSKLFRIFRQGLLKIAKTTDVWIITNGISTSVTKLLGEIIRTNPDPSRSIHLIGITQWGCISNVDQLDIHGGNVFYNKSKNDENDETPLEPNHTDFIFIDDGTKHKYESEIQFRSQFEKSILGESFSLNPPIERKSSQNISENIPVVLVVIGGGIDTIKKVYQSVIENQIPVVLLEGTGGCCDRFAKCYELYNLYHSKEKSVEEEPLDSESGEEFSGKNEEIKTKLREKLNVFDRKLSTDSCLNLGDEIDYFELIYQCIENGSRFLNFVDLKVHNYVEPDLDLAILQALLHKDNLSEKTKEKRREQFNLAFEWKRVDIIKNLIMQNEQDWKTIELDDLFEKALIENQPSFIQLFLDHDFPLNDLFIDNNKLRNLYQNQEYQSWNSLEDIYKEIIQPLIGDFFQVNAIFDNQITGQDCNIKEGESSWEMDVEKELFLWSVLTGKHELALLFWARGKNKICAALIATLIYKRKSKKEKDEKYIESANEFQNLAVEILEKFYSTHHYECTQAIIREIPQFGNVTWLHLAVMAEAKLFIAQKGIQDVLNDICGFLPFHKELVEGSEEANKTNNFQDRSNIFQRSASKTKYNIQKESDPVCSKLMDHILYEEENSTPPADDIFLKRTQGGVKQYLKNILMFLEAPCVKYLYNLYFHVIFLLLFSYLILCDFFPLYDFESDKCLPSTEEHSDSDILINNVEDSSTLNITKNNSSVSKFGLERHNQPTISELILIVWIFTLFCEEIRQIFAIEIQSIYGKLVAYFSIFWNQLDVIAILLFFIAFILRFLPLSQCFCAARIVLAIDLCIWYIRTLDIFSAIQRLGPKLMMIGEMVHDLKFYMLMLTVFILAYGVPTYSLIYGVQKFSWHLPRAILNLAYWEIFGELQVLDDIEKNYSISGYVVFILLVCYMTIASVLLINLLIAMFSNTFDRLHLDTDCIWKFQHYGLVCYHLTRPSLPPPLVLFSHINLLIIYIFSHLFRIKWFEERYIQHKNRSKFKIIADEMLTRKIETLEDALGNEVYFLFIKTDRKQIDHQNVLNEERVHSPQEIVLSKIKTLENQVQAIQNQQGNMFQYMEYLMNGIKKIGGDDIDMPKQSRQDSAIIV